MSRRPVIYVAGPYTGDQASNVRQAIHYAEQLEDAGVAPLVPHLCHLWDLMSPHGYEFWTRLDNDLVYICDGLFRMPGKSPGAEDEVTLARSLGKPVFYTIEAVLTYRKKQWRADAPEAEG